MTCQKEYKKMKFFLLFLKDIFWELAGVNFLMRT